MMFMKGRYLHYFFAFLEDKSEFYKLLICLFPESKDKKYNEIEQKDM